MDFELSDDQRAILEAVVALLAQHAGPERAIQLGAKGDYDFALDGALFEAGFREVARADGAGFLEAALVCEACARAGGVVAYGAQALVAAALCEQMVDGPVALARAGQRGPVRFAAHARSVLVEDGAEARLVSPEPGSVEPAASSFGYPMGRFAESALAGGVSLGEGSGERLRAWWRVALAAEMLGTMRACLEVTIAYLEQRRQFGRAIGSFQAVQHRLAECAVGIEGARWLAYEAAAAGAPPALSATAAAWAAETALRVFGETHQLSGAIGFTREHDLHVWSMRLQALRLELGGVGAHRRAVARARYGSAP